jgi:atypical dual specificity phosphatase
MEIEATTASLRPYKGTISLFAPDLPLNHDLEPGHVTLLTPAEYKTLNKPTVTSIYTRLTLDKIYVIGEGGSKDGSVRWKVVVWNKGNIWRKVMGLPPKDFHVTLTAVDDWNVENRLGSLINRSESNALVQRIREIGLEAMNHTIVACGDNHEDFVSSHSVLSLTIQRRQLAELVIVDHPDSAKGFVRHAETSTSFPKLRVLSLAQAVSRQVSLFPLVSPRIERLHESTSCGPSCTADELAGIPEALVRYLTAPWPPCLRESESLRRIFWSHPTVSRDRQIYNGYELPRFFSWVYPFRVAGMSTPRNEDDIDALSEMGFTDILSLTLESPLPKTWFHLKQIKQTFIPLKNYGAPTLAEMDVILERIEAGGTWLVHCGDGVGRAGTALACLVAMFGEGHDTE